MKIQSKIIIPVTVLLVCVVGAISYFSYQKASEALEEALVENMDGQANALAAATRDLMLEVKRDVARSAGRPEVIAFFSNPEDKAHIAATSDALKSICDSYLDIVRISVLDATGRTSASSDPSTIGTNFANRNYFQQAINGETFLAPPFLSTILNGGAVVASAPIKVQGVIKGVLICTVSLDAYYHDFVKPIKVGNDGFGYVLNGSALIVAHKNPDFAFKKDHPDFSLHQDIIKQKEGTKEYVDKRGKTVRLRFLTEEISGSTLVIQADRNDVFAPLLGIRNTSLVIGIIAVILGAAVAFGLARAISRPLQSATRYAEAIAQGDFSRTVNSTSKDEIGCLVRSINQIPEALRRIIASAENVSNGIRTGLFRERLDVNGFQGSYRELALAVNTVSDSYTATIDALPVPIMVCAKDHKIIFLNAAAQSVAGSNALGESCARLDTPGCGTVSALGKRTMDTGTGVTEETTITAQGRSMEVAVSTMPLRDAAGEPAGYFEVLSDLTQIKSQQKTMLRVAEQASAISDHVAAASEELSAQIEQVARGAETQRKQMESTANAMTEMNSTVLKVARNAGQAAEQSEDTRQKADDGLGMVSRMVRSINTVNGVAGTLQNNMRELGTLAEGIGHVMNVINDIADQTNVLALNAAIEAAHAGEAGRGFAVVADEVRKLAEKTMSATHEVGSSINAIQQSARTNMEEVDNSVKSIVEATELADSSGAALEKIVSLASANASVVASIATAAEEQSATSEEISRAVDSINTVTAETAEGTAQASEAVRELSRMAQELHSIIGALK